MIKTRPVNIQKKNTIRGILKYPPGWPKRFTLSESDSGIFSRSISADDGIGSYYGRTSSSSLQSPGILMDCFGYDDNDDDDDDANGDGFCIDDLMKPKKCVTFSDKQATFVFRPGSSILGRRQKNQKKAKKKKEREIRKMISSLEQLQDDDDDDDNDGNNRRISRQQQRLSMINNLRRYVDNDNDDLDSFCSSPSSVSSLGSSSGCDDTTTSASDCSSADEMSSSTMTTSQLNPYENEIDQNDNGEGKQKSKRKIVLNLVQVNCLPMQL